MRNHPVGLQYKEGKEGSLLESCNHYRTSVAP